MSCCSSNLRAAKAAICRDSPAVEGNASMVNTGTVTRRHTRTNSADSKVYRGPINKQTAPRLTMSLEGCVGSLRSSMQLLDSSINILEEATNDFPRLAKVLQTTRVRNIQLLKVLPVANIDTAL